MRLNEIKEMKVEILWAGCDWKRWLRRDGKLELFTTKKACEKYHVCEAVKVEVIK